MKNDIIRRVVVTGMGAVTPVGNDVETLWSSLVRGAHGIAPITRFNTEGFKAKLAAEVKGFDPRSCMERSEVLRSDLYAQYAMAAACQAVAQSGVIGTLPPERTAVYMGSGIGGIQTFEAEHGKLVANGPRRVSPYFVPMMIGNMASGLVAIRFDCRGAAMPAVTACASGSNAIGEALRAIRHGYADAAIAGGAEAAICPMAVAGFSNMQALSASEDPEAASLPFDRRRAGFVLGEGAGALVLEEYEHAKKRGARILAEVCGYGSTCDAHHITAPLPDARGGAQAMEQALEEAGYDGAEAVYVNAHGTGTPLNDSAETLAAAKWLNRNVLGEYVHFRENAAAADGRFPTCPMLMFVANGPASCESMTFESGFSWVKAHQQTAERAGGKCYVLPGGHYLHWMFPDEMARHIREEFT